MDDLIENYQRQIDKICELLNKSLLLYSNKIEFSNYDPVIIKSGINKFAGEKYYLDTSSINGVNNIISNELITYDKRPLRANMQPIPRSVWFAKMKGSNKELIITDKDNDLIDNSILSTGFQGIKESNNLPLSLLAAFIISDDFNIQRDLNSVGTTMAGINNETLIKIFVPNLNKKEIDEYNKKYGLHINLLSLRRRQLIYLKNIKDKLLQKYF